MEQDGKQSIEGQGEIFGEGITDILAPTAKSLIAIGAAAALNCHTCLNYLIPAAVHNGVLEEEIKAAISLVGQIKGNAARFTDKLVADLLLQQGTAGESKSECC
jgi:alkylhydroperoxidase/carboxymuconolactone decarboxylase family protein YurZ